MSFRPIDDSDKGADEYFKKYFVFRAMTEKESLELLADMYMELSPKIIDLVNKYIIKNNQYLNFFVFGRFLAVFMLKTLDNNVRVYPEAERRKLMERQIEDIKHFIDNYMNGTDFSGPRLDPKYFSDPEKGI